MENNAHLWKNEAGEITGLFISESGGGFFSLIVHPDYPHLADEMVAWTRNVWGKGKKRSLTQIAIPMVRRFRHYWIKVLCKIPISGIPEDTILFIWITL
ncbi:hypothetical protein ACFTAO_16115 [Paenibacillus rhizoplanae]